jgi:Co/Zn/Cd efflux system component
MLADSLGSLCVIISMFLVKNYGLLLADSLSSFIVSCFIMGSAIPFLRQTVSHLVLQASPSL